MAYSSFFYNWSLKTEAPESLIYKPVDAWSGNPDVGRALTKGLFQLHGQEMRAAGKFWHPQDCSSVWLDYLHKFEWLRDLRALGGDHARYSMRAYLQEWIRQHPGWEETSWQPARLGKRLCMWLALYDFYGDSADEDFQEQILDSILRQARHLYRIMPVSETGLDILESLCGLIYAGLSLPGGERWLDYGLEAIAYEAELQILQDGGHISRSADTLLKAVMLLTDIRSAIIGAGYPLPHSVQHALDRAIPALRFFRYPDKGFGAFHATQTCENQDLERIIIQTGAKGRVPKSLPSSGYERLSAGRTLLMVDTGNAAPWPYDRRSHTAPAAFELSIARERVFVACGTHPLDCEWQEMLRGTAAHNALSLDHRNAFEIRKNGTIGRKAKKITMSREEMGSGELLSVTHDSYVPVNGIIHQRKLYLDHSGNDIRGEEDLSAKTGTITRPVAVAIRFHLHPRVLVSLIREGEEALLLLPSGAGWRFNHDGARLSLENSVYLGEGTYPRKTKQLVLSAVMKEPQMVIQWALQKEGI
jgi:uncharacterized heparinase superfamily protein